ncbi:MAG: thioredoxin domain-containing protein [Dehalococcoidia bacterium]
MKKGKLIGKIFGIVLVFVMLTSTLGGLVWARESDVEGAGNAGVSVEQAKDTIDSDPDIVSVDNRIEDTYEAGHIAGSELVTLSELEGSTEGLDEDSTQCSSIGDQFEQGCSSADSRTSATSTSGSLLSSEIDAILASNKPVFLFFYADWCHFCQEQTPIIDELEQEYSERIAFIRVESQENPQAFEEFGVTGFPTMFLIADKNEQGYVQQEFGGFKDKEILEESLDYVIENGSLPEDSGLPQSGWSLLSNEQGDVGKCKCPPGSNKGNRQEERDEPNGCSPWFLVPENPTFPWNPYGPCTFHGACDGHDSCWGTCESSKDVCDLIFYGNMLNACELCKDEVWWTSYADCQVHALEYYLFVRLSPLSLAIFLNGQRKACGEACCCNGEVGDIRRGCIGNSPFRAILSQDCKWEAGNIKPCLEGTRCNNGECVPFDTGDNPDPGNDHPDDNYDVSTPKTISNNTLDPEILSEPEIAVIFKGFPLATEELLESFSEPVTFLDISFSPDLVSDYPILIIPSGGLYGLDSLPSFKSNLEQYVENGGTLVVFSQQHGYEYNALPGGEVSGYGWLEDQSCHYGSVGINTYHPILSGQDSVTPDMNVDGYFTSYPDNATVLLSRTKNGMPAMLMYEYGEGRVIATTAYTDWAYGRGQATQDEIYLVRDMVAWAKNPAEIKEYGASDTVDVPVDVVDVNVPIPETEIGYLQHEPGDIVSIPVETTNYSDNQTSDRVVFSVYDPDYEVVDMDVPTVIPPGETMTVDFTYETTGLSKTGVYLVLYSLHGGETIIGGGFGGVFGLGVDISGLSTYKVNFTLRDPDKSIVQEETTTITVPAGEIQAAHFTYADPSKLGIWSLEYEILDYNDLLIDSGVERFAVSKYAENPDGWVYQGKNIAFAVSSPEERYAYGSDVPFTIHVWNNGDTDRSISFSTYYKDWMLSTKLPEQNVDGTLDVPAGGEATFTHTLHVGDIYLSQNQLIIYATFSEDGNNLGRTEKVIWMFSPSIDVSVSTDKQEYVKGEDVSILLSLKNKRSTTYDVSTIVRVLDAENNKVFEESFDVTLPGDASHEETFSFSLSTTYGVYVVSAEAYVGGNKVGSGSTYFEVVKDYLMRVAFDHPDKIYTVRDSMGIDLEAINAGSTPWSSIVNISVPFLGFSDSVDFALDPGQTEQVSYNLSISENITAGKHEVILTVEFDNSTEEYYFFIPQSELVLTTDRTSYDAGENLSIDLSNTGGVDTTGDCSIRFYDSHGLMIYEEESQESVQAGESKTLEFRIPEQAVGGDYYLMAWCKDLSTDKVTRLSKSCTVEGLKASLTSVTDKKTYFTDEDISISTNITNLDGEIVDGSLNLKIFSRIGLPGSMLADSAGKEFFLVYTDNYYDGYDSAVFITSDIDTSGIVEIPEIGFSQPFTVTADTIATVNIPSSAEVSGSDNVEDKGIHVLAEDDVTVYFLNPSTPVATNDAYLALPVDILGTEYVILAYQETLSARGGPTEGPSELAIVAPYDDTVVTITPSVTIGGLDLRETLESLAPTLDAGAACLTCGGTKSTAEQSMTAEPLDAGVPYTITLQRFQTYTLQSDSPLEDLTGTIIESSAPVAVFAGVRCADIPAGYGCCDHIVEQMMPVATWGKEFDTFPFMPRLNGRGDFLRILASMDETVMTVNGSVIGTINRGEFLEITVTEPLEISATEPVLVAQYLTGEQYEGRTGDPFECLIPPTEQFLSKYTFVTPTGYAENFVNVVIPTSSLNDLLLDGSPIDAGVFSPFGTRGLSAETIALSEGSHTMLGSAPFGIYVYGYDQYVSYGYPGGLSLKALKKHLIWEKTIPIDISALELKNIVTNIDIPSEMPDITGKLDLVATLYTSASQIIGQSEGYSFFITGEDISFTMETDKEVYKPNETITIYGEVQNNDEVANDYSLSIKKDGGEIFTDSFSVAPGESHSFTTDTSSERSFTLEGAVDGITIADFITIEYPNVDVTIIAPDVVGLGDFVVGILVENVASVDCDINVTMVDEAWDVLIPAGESRLMETTMSITEDTTLDVIISGDVEKTVQKNIIMGEDARIEITPQNIYLEGIVEIPFTVENTGVLNTEFEATFSISSPEEQTIIRTLFIPQGVSIADTLSFNLTRGKHLLTYRSPFEEGTMEICVGMPEFVVTELPSNLNLTLGQEVTWTFKVGNIGGAEGEAHLYLMLPDWEETKSTWIMPGQEEEISFDFTVADDLEEKEYKAIYELDGVRDEFTFFVQGAKVSVNAALDKALYEEGETAILTLTVTNECDFDLSLYVRVKLDEYEEVRTFDLVDSETLVFNVPVTFNGNKLFYGIYMESGRALYLNSIYVHEKEDIISLYTDKQVYFTGETVTVFVNTTQSGILNITAPGYAEELTIDDSTVLTFALPELRSGTYYIDYTFDSFSSSYSFDVIGYSAKIIEFGLDKESYSPGELIFMEANVEVNRDVTGLLRVRIYGPEYNALDEFDIPVALVQGENAIEAERIFLPDKPGIHYLVYQLFGDLAGHSLVLLSSGAEYFDGISGNTPPVADAGLDRTVRVIPPATTAMVTLNGSGSYDPDGDPLTYIWTWDGNSAYGVNPMVELPLGTTTITLVVNDGKADSEPDSINVTLILLGDANGDGAVNTGDITKVKRIYFGMDPTTNRADVNGDGKIDTGDITAIRLIYFGASG